MSSQPSRAAAAAILLLCVVPCAVVRSGSSAPLPEPPPINRFPQLKPVGDYNDVGVVVGDVDEPSPTNSIGPITSASVSASVPNQVDIECGNDRLRVQFWRLDVVRIWAAWDGTDFTDDATADVVTGTPVPSVRATLVDRGDYYEMSGEDSAAAGDDSGGEEGEKAGGGVTLRAAKPPSALRFSLYGGGARGSLLWEESAPLSRNLTATFQSLLPASEGAPEAFFGGGMQNGRLMHAGSRIKISNDFNWADGGNPNAVPYYVSSRGYGAYRNTWSPGYYDFATDGSVVAAHNETDRFDAFYMASSSGAQRPARRDFKVLLGLYVYLLGPPFLPPTYALGLGDSDCYHNDRHGNNTRVVLAVADEYRARDIPALWFLINDGYGCGFGVGPSHFPKNFTELDVTAAELRKRGFEVGLWSSTGLPNITREVAGSGARVFKTDVGWIGAGYKYALDALKVLTSGIEDNSDARRFLWTVEGWAGTHRYAVVWTGDDYGTFDYIRWQIPTFAGCGFSAQAHASGDVDGIFGGSPETYVRDLQMKSLTTTIMVMSGWAANPDKQPWTWGEPYTSINRMYLKLKEALGPYQYTLSRLAYDTGVPPVRAMALEFPEDDALLINGTGSAMQFMVGPYLLVAPVYRPLGQGGDKRDGIYLPANHGGWVDYWDGTPYGSAGDDDDGGGAEEPPVTLDGYPSPLEKLPFFVRAGAILPMRPPSSSSPRADATTPPLSPPPPDTLILEVFPPAAGHDGTFELYEDDGVTREALDSRRAAFLRTKISVFSAPPTNATGTGGNCVSLGVDAARGNGFPGAAKERAYDVRVRWRSGGGGAPSPPPREVTLVVVDDAKKKNATTTLPALKSLDAVRFALKYGSDGGWYDVLATEK